MVNIRYKLLFLITVSLFFIYGCATAEITGDTALDIKDIEDASHQAAAHSGDNSSEDIAQTDEYSVECNEDADCGETVLGEPYCFQNGVVEPITRQVCVNPGTIKSYCKRESKDIVNTCDSGKEICRGARCLVIAEQPCKDSDGGKNYTEAGKVFDAELMEYKDNCKDKHNVIEYFCKGGNKGVAQSEQHFCSGGKCVNGACVE